MFQVSLRSLLVLVAMAALAIVSLRFASPAWQTAVLTIALVVFWAAAIVAWVDRGARQAFAIGCALSMLVYGAILMSAGPFDSVYHHPELNPDTGRLPTTRLLIPVYRALAEVSWYDFSTGEAIANDDRRVRGNVAGSQRVSLRESPNRHRVAAIGHSWWAVVLGLCGGCFARFVYLRRIRDDDTLASGRS